MYYDVLQDINVLLNIGCILVQSMFIRTSQCTMSDKMYYWMFGVHSYILCSLVHYICLIYDIDTLDVLIHVWCGVLKYIL